MDVSVPGRFALVRELGAGGMGKVYEATDHELRMNVALKILHEGDGEAIEKLKQEFRVAADVRHDNLIKLGELFEHGERWCFSMELVHGVDLITHVARRPRVKVSSDLPTAPRGLRTHVDDSGEKAWGSDEANFDEDKLRKALVQLAAGVAALHEAGIVHRDIKPSNIRVTPDGRVVLLDLGLASRTIELSDATQLAGTVPYMAPEQTETGIVTTAADLYAIGAVLYEALVGRPPFVGPNMVVIVEKTTMDPIAPSLLFPEVPPDLDRLCMSLLSRDPKQRPSAGQVAAQLAKADVAPAKPVRSARAFVGREQELKTLLRAGERARHTPTVRVVTGASGIGKTRLLGRFAQACRDYGVFVCHGRCRVREHVRLNAWEALLDGLTRMLSALPRVDALALLPDGAEEISRLFPIFARVLPVTSSSTLPAVELERRAITALRELLRRVATKMNVVVVIDDVQWATQDSLDLFAQLLAPPEAPPIALVLGLRTSETQTDTFASWLEAVSDLEIDLSMMALGPLEPNEARSLAQLLVADRERAEKIAAETAGHPLFLELLAASSQGSDALHRTMRRTIKDLSPALREVLGVVAASSVPLRVDLLGAALGRDPFVLADELRGLLVQKLVSVSGLRRSDHVEAYHSQVTEAVLAVVPQDELRGAHVKIANALETMPFLHPERRALHWAWAGDAERAAHEAIALVAVAKHALAYARAADVCETVMKLELSSVTRAALARATADALAGSGLASRAAIAYRDAAAGTDGDTRLDLERRAAENFLRTGNQAEGMALANRVAEQLGYKPNRAPATTIANLLLERARLRLRGTDPRTGEIDKTLAAKSDACYSLSTGLAMVDAISGALFQTRSTRFALDCGDPARAARALSVEACFVAAWGSSTRKRAGRIAEAAEKLAAQVGDPILVAMVRTARGICELQWGDFAPAIANCDAAIASFREHGFGVVWEEHTADVFAMWGLAWRGDWGEVARRCDRLARAGAATGDRYASLHAAVGVAVCGLLAADNPTLARARISEVMAKWPRESYDLIQVRELVGLASVALYEGNGKEALHLMRSQWRALEKSHMLGLEPLFGTVADLRVRAALVAGELAEAKAWSKKLEAIPWGTGVAAATRAAIAAAKRDHDTALAELRSAEQHCTRSGLDLHAAAIADRIGSLVGGDEGKAARDQAAAFARAKELRNAERAFQSLVPWPN